MTRQRLLRAGLFIAIVSIVAISGDADARNRCRNGGIAGGRGWQQNNNYAYNSGTNYYGAQNGDANGNMVYPNTMNANSNTANPAMNSNTVNPSGIQNNGTYSVSKPVTNAAAVQAGVPQPIVGTAPINQNPQPVQENSSPDPDNEGRNASKIPGTAPTKAPAPAADALPR